MQTREDAVRLSNSAFDALVKVVRAYAGSVNLDLSEVKFENNSNFWWSPWVGWFPSYQMKATYPNGGWQMFDIQLSSTSPKLVVCQLAADLGKTIPNDFLLR